MKAYWIAHVDVTDPTRYVEYTSRAPAVFAQYGGRLLARGGRSEALEGRDTPQRSVVIEFRPGDESRSVLLLGDGQTMSLGQLAVLPFRNVQLLADEARDRLFTGRGCGHVDRAAFGGHPQPAVRGKGADQRRSAREGRLPRLAPDRHARRAEAKSRHGRDGDLFLLCELGGEQKRYSEYIRVNTQYKFVESRPLYILRVLL